MKNNEKYQISSSVDEGLLKIVITGTLTRFNISQLQKEIDSLRAAKGDKLLVDARVLNVGLGYENVLYHVRSPEKATGKTAIVDFPEKKQIDAFYQTIAINTYYKVKWFSDIDKARTWLKKTECH